MGFPFVPKSVALNELELLKGCYFVLFHRMGYVEPITSQW